MIARSSCGGQSRVIYLNIPAEKLKRMHPDKGFERGMCGAENDIEREISGLDQEESKKESSAGKRRH